MFCILIFNDEELKSYAPYVPSRPEAVRKMLELANVSSEDIVYDLGYGDGRILKIAIEKFRAKKAVGYELKDHLYKSCLQDIERSNLKNKFSFPSCQIQTWGAGLSVPHY